VITTALVVLCAFAHRHRPADLRGRRQRKGGEALRHQDRAACLSELREHGALAALAGLVFASRLNTATPKDCGYWA
jgi:hypothetical protein